MGAAQAGARPQRLVLLVLFVAAVVGGWFPFRSRPTSELPVYVEGAARMAAGEAIYRKSDPKPFTYPPFFAVPFLPLVKVPAEHHRLVWYGANLAALAALVALCARLVRDGTTSGGARVAFWCGIVLLAGRHLSSVLENQSHDLLVALFVVAGADAWNRSRGACAGAWWGLAAACKATPLLFLVPLVVRREFKATASLIVVTGALTLLPDLVCPQSDGKLWVVAWFETFLSGLAAGGTASAEGAWTAGSFLNQSLSGTLHRLTTSVANPSGFVQDVALLDLGETPKKLVTLAAQLAVVGLLALLAGGRGPRREFGLASAVACGMVLLSPMSSKAHFCILVLPAAFCARSFLVARDGLLAVLLCAWLVLGTLTVKGIVGIGLGNTFLAYGSVTGTALIALLATARGLRLQARQGAP